MRYGWKYCLECGRSLTWGDTQRITNAECYKCGWIVSDHFSWCPWCGTDIYEEGFSSPEPIRNPKGFRLDVRCDWHCGGYVHYPMPFCPWCSKPQTWNEDTKFEGNCPHCTRGVDDWMSVCPWCGNDATGQDLITRALTRARRLLLVSRIRPWGYRVLLRPGRGWGGQPVDWAEASFDVDLPAEGDVRRTVRIRKGGRLQITVRDVDGRDLPARVVLTDERGQEVFVWFCADNAEGGWIVDAGELPGVGPCWVEPVLPPCELEVLVELEGYEPARRQVALEAGRPKAVDVVLERSR